MRFLRIILLLILSLSILSMSGKKCKKYFPGKWEYAKPLIGNQFVIRTIDKQLEYIENGKYYYEFELTWLSECKYQSVYKGTNSPNPAATKIGETATVEILEIDKNRMKYKTTFRDIEDVGEMIRVK